MGDQTLWPTETSVQRGEVPESFANQQNLVLGRGDGTMKDMVGGIRGQAVPNDLGLSR